MLTNRNYYYSDWQLAALVCLLEDESLSMDSLNSPPGCAAGLSFNKQRHERIIFSHSSPGQQASQNRLTACQGWELR